MDFSREIKRIRKELDWNQAEFADALGTSQGSVSKWESGRETPRAEMLYKIQSLYSSAAAAIGGADYDFDRLPELIDVPLVCPIGLPTSVDILDPDTVHERILSVPKHPSAKGSVLAWSIPRMPLTTHAFKSGQIVFTYEEGSQEPEDGEMVVIRVTYDDGSLRYDLKHYGRSEKGFEWFTSFRVTSRQISIEDALRIDEREANGITIVGIVFAAIQYQSSRQRFWDDVFQQAAADHVSKNM